MESRPGNSSAEAPARPDRRSGLAVALRAGIGLAILAGLFVGLQVDGAAVLEALSRANPLLLVLAAPGVFLLLALKSWRWSLLVRRTGVRYGLGAAFRAYLGGFALGIFTPGRLGELARAFQLRSETGLEGRECLRTVLSDRAHDLVFLLAFGVAALVSILTPVTTLPVGTGMEGAGSPLTAFSASFFFLLLFLGILAVATVSAAMAARLLARVSRVKSRWRILDETARCAGDVAGDLGGRFVWIGTGITCLAYATYFTTSWILLRAVGIDMAFVDASIVTGALSLVLLLPISVAGLGTREAALIALLGRYGVAREAALAYSILQFAGFFVLGGLAGGLALLVSRSASGTGIAVRSSAFPASSTPPLASGGGSGVPEAGADATSASALPSSLPSPSSSPLPSALPSALPSPRPSVSVDFHQVTESP